MADNILEVRNLTKYFKTSAGMLHAVDDVSFSVARGSTMGLVGESGCGKTTIGRLILGLLDPTGGEILFEGERVHTKSHAKILAMRENLQIIFQDPYSSLNPRMSVSEIIAEPLFIHHKVRNTREAEVRAGELMDTVGLAARLFNSYPHELDGGRRQRVGIARALALTPRFIVCDEPVSSLDVSIRAQILNLLKDLQDEFHLTYLFITHDLSVVKYFSDTISVMYLGQMVETADADELFRRPLHPYTKALLSAIPIPSLDQKMRRVKLKGELASPIDPLPGCRFAKRCLYLQEDCSARTTSQQRGFPDERHHEDCSARTTGLVEQNPGHRCACPRAAELTP